ncbi:SRPBCC family protein [Nocardia sp. alder85J]|uniref:SRPBCC family protein n=1 Tax=Nocardia sp. alder85J TaxID=2862949 RepID=UPI001CD200D2|nr:SRPBCC family protein [Nocardia sp. alder85J]MCX4095201.1 SRPBCC family protein [Nocardia sp. alder85J]
MKLENTFGIPVPAADAWKVLLDLERIAPCVPGATLTGSEGDAFQGRIKVKLGPIALTYNGTIRIVSADETARIAVLEGGGREARGNGTAKATITCRLVESGDKTEVFVDTDLNITGKPAQFGRGALAEVAGALIGQFADNLADLIVESATAAPVAEHFAETAAEPIPHQTSPSDPAGTVAPAAVLRSGSGTGANVQPAARPAAEPIDLLSAAGIGGERVGLVAAVVALLVVLVLWRRDRRRLSAR